MRTGKHLKIKSMGDNALGVTLEGNPTNPEPIHFRVAFPGGDVDIVRTTDGQYWAHFRVNHPEAGGYDMDSPAGTLACARIDAVGVSPTDKVEAIADQRVYHVAFRVGVVK